MGGDSGDPEGLIQMFMDDPECMEEYAPLLEEVVWQFKSLVLEISRQWPEAIEKDGVENPVHAWLREMKLAL